MSKKINPFVIKDNLIFYIDLENDKSREKFAIPEPQQIFYESEPLTYNDEELFITLNFNKFASVTAFRDLVHNINLFSNIPTLCFDTRNLFFKFKKTSFIYDSQEIKNYFDSNNFSILLWTRNTESEGSTNVDSIIGQIIDPNTESSLVFLGGADKQITGIDGTFQLLVSALPPNKSIYINQNNIEVFWDTIDQSWNIGSPRNSNLSFFKSREDVIFPWQVTNWIPLISSVRLDTNLPTLSVLNDIFKYNSILNSKRLYKTTNNYNDIISNSGSLWNITLRSPRSEFNIPFYTSLSNTQEPWQNTSWITNVSCLSTSSGLDHGLVDNYLTFNSPAFRVDSAGIKQTYRSEGFFRQNFNAPEVLVNWKNLTHITFPRTLNIAGTAPAFLSLNKNYTQTSNTSRVFQSGTERLHIITDSPYWRIDWLWPTFGTSRGTFIADQIVDWPWEVQSWTPLITSFSLSAIAPNYFSISGIYITFKDDPQAVNRELPYYYYQVGAELIMVYDEVFGISTFTVETEYPSLQPAFFRATTFTTDNSTVFRFYPNPNATNIFYSMFRSAGIWKLYGTLRGVNSLFDIEIARSLDINQPSPRDVSNWISSVTALSTSRGGIAPETEGDYDVDAQAYFARVGNNIPENEKTHIDAFVKGCKKLGLWQHITCWPLINNQNTGTINVYSLGGAGIADGTLENGPNGSGPIQNNPTWTSLGLFASTPNKRVKTFKKRTDYNQRTFYAAARANTVSFFARGQLIHTGYSEAQNIIYSLENTGMGLNVNRGGQGGASIGYATSTVNASLSAIVINPTPSYNLNTWSSFATVFSGRNLSYFVNGLRRGTFASPSPASGGTWADSITDGETLTLMGPDDYKLTVPQSNGGVGLVGYMAFGADFDIHLTDSQIQSFDSLYKFTLGRNLPSFATDADWNDTFLLANSDTLLQDQNYSRPFFSPDQVNKPSAPLISIAFLGDRDPTQTTYGITTSWYYLYEGTVAFSASNPQATWPWDVKEWVPYPRWAAFTAPTATPIKIDNVFITQNSGLSGWLIKAPTTNNIFVTAGENYNKTLQPWAIDQWVDISNQQPVTTINQQILASPTITEFKQISGWFWQYGSSFTNAYSAESVVEFPWDVEYELWKPAANIQFNNILPPKITKTLSPEISVTPFYDDSYFDNKTLIMQIGESSLLKQHNGKLGFQLSNQIPKFSTSIGKLEPGDKDWCLVSLVKNENEVYLYKDLKYQIFTNNTGTFNLSAFTIGFSNIDVGQIMFYNRPLSSVEILQTYRQFKGRYKKNLQPVGPISEAIEDDAFTYAEISGATNIKDISNFISGVKEINLWNNMICWPMRNGQNSSSGPTVHALGGLVGIGEASGTLGTLGNPPGLPLWRTDGIEFSGIKINSNFWPQNYMISNPFPFNTSCAFYCVINFDFAGLNTDVDSVLPVIMNARPSNPDANYHFPRRVGLYRRSQTPPALSVDPNSIRYGLGLGPFSSAQQFQINGPLALDDNNNWAAIGMSYSLDEQLYSRNGGNFTNGNLVQNPSFPIINEDYVMMLSTIQRPVDGFRGLGASYFWFNKYLTQDEHTAFYNVYKNTIGKGLGLP